MEHPIEIVLVTSPKLINTFRPFVLEDDNVNQLPLLQTYAIVVDYDAFVFTEGTCYASILM